MLNYRPPEYMVRMAQKRQSYVSLDRSSVLGVSEAIKPQQFISHFMHGEVKAMAAKHPESIQ